MESFNEIVARERQKLESASANDEAKSRLSQDGLQRAAQLAIQVTTESTLLASHLRAKGIRPDVDAMNKEKFLDARAASFPPAKRWGKGAGFVPTPQSDTEKHTRKFGNMIAGHTFPVWELGTEWSVVGKYEPWDTLYRENYVLSADGILLNKTLWQSPIGVEQIDFAAYVDDSRFESMRAGLARLAARHSVEF